MPETARSKPETVRIRVLEKGRERVFTGQYDERALKFTKFAVGEEIEITRDIAEALVERGFAKILEAAAAPGEPVAPASALPRRVVEMPDDPVQRTNWSLGARERLVARAERRPDTGCLVWRGARTANGYGGITYLAKTYTVHRLAWLASNGPVPSGFHVCHVCDNRMCLELSHLFLGTPRQNTVDMLSKGRGRVFGRGKRLAHSAVAAIKRRLQNGEKIRDLAEEMKVSVNTIGDIKRGKTWTFVEPG